MKPFKTCALALALTFAAQPIAISGTEESKPSGAPSCAGVADDFFRNEVWAKVGAASCLKCHKSGGDAEKSQFVLRDPGKSQAPDDALRHNREAFAKVAKLKEKEQSRLLLKVVGQLEHGGEDVLKPDSAGYRILADFVRRANATAANVSALDTTKIDRNAPPFFAGIAMIDDRRLLRRVALSLAGRLPTDAELSSVAKQGLKAMPKLLDAMMNEEAFYDRLREGFNDVFLTLGVDGNPEASVLSYEHFSTTRLWYQKFDLSAAGDQKAQTQARYKLADDYRKALLGEPMKLIEHIVREGRPFTEIVTADYIMVTPYTARGYGIFDELKDEFEDADDPFEYIPVKLKKLVARTRNDDQESATGFYPHAGLLGAFQYLRRYPTTETNRNRLRARMYYQHFLGVDVLELAARVSDAAAVSAKYAIPTMQASECVVCHKTIDPVAGLFQDFYKFEGVYGRRKEGWYKDMFGPGLEGETMPATERWRALQWLGERTARDPRFAVAMVEHVYYILSGRKALLPPKDLDDPLFAAKRRAYQAQRCEIEAVAARFAQTGFNLKNVFKDLIVSDFYRADGMTIAVKDPARRAELDDIGVARMLAPEQVERKLKAIFGERWGRLNDQLAILYGGIDSKEVTERATDPSGAMGAIQRILSNDVACRQTLRDFAQPASERRLFPGIEPNALPGSSPEADAAIRKAIIHLHERILGRNDAPDSDEVKRTFALFAGIVADAKGKKGLDSQETYNCRQGVASPPADPDYTIRAWRGVVTYLLRRPEFLYE